jgi:hypothetical protein
MTTRTLQSLIDKASTLPPDLQEQFAKQWLAELDDEELWDRQFADSQGALESMANKALENFRNGKTLPKGWDDL